MSVVVALDWTPNTNHTGLYIAKARGFYKDEGLDVKLVSPHVNNYKTTPANRVALKEALFAICPSESVISYHTHNGTKPQIRAVATILSTSTSAIVTLDSSGIDRPAKLEGKLYASYGARYEGRIVQQMIIDDGGKGDFVESTPPMLGIWNTLLEGKADATWVFMGWEGIEAEMRGVKLNVFKLEDSQVPYGYSPLLVTHPDTIEGSPDMVRKFLNATSRGYKLAAEHPEEAARIFLEAVQAEHVDCPLPEPLDASMVVKSHLYTAQHLLDGQGRWGHQELKAWDAFLDWLSDRGLLTKKCQSREQPDTANFTSLDGLRQGDVGDTIPRNSVDSSSLFTNDLLPPSN
ncbi:hypothetical protein CEUSTIGMA_g5012.t1 [Chlamydomonas eustigma]|uniref:Thiamine pyrimidine synthase n=1 Tax=Chlamydomonas eustigma TaxID=1157962 RepID=A0A250X3C0_9CHLO|nr:hypothetical protein CEUSTIGMA_g5012.t1 [Chlamydomonas eustigma]|eukprot:GAX77568.1 hypothetical protein CEUSTIGMA_g5012.t1 [Chlamydomonas eustigma]